MLANIQKSLRPQRMEEVNNAENILIINHFYYRHFKRYNLINLPKAFEFYFLEHLNSIQKFYDE